MIISTEVPLRRKCIVVSVEAPWPTLNGGRTRTSEVIKQLAEVYDVTVIYPCQPAEAVIPSTSRIDLIAVNAVNLKPRMTDRLGLLPRLGKFTMRIIDYRLQLAIEQLRPEFVYWSHSYLAAVGMSRFSDVVHVVEFANLESQRSLSLSRSSQRIGNKISALTEYFKGLWWEPRCARRAGLSISLNQHEASTLQGYGANIVLVPNGLSQREYTPSPTDSYKIFTLGSWGYGPNQIALERFLRNYWNAILEREPRMELVVAGPGSDSLMDGGLSNIPGVTSLGYVEDLSQAFKDCFCFLAPANSGGGSQLKIAEALSRHRVVVGPSFLRREISPEMPKNVVIATDDIVQSVIDLAHAPERRHSLEKAVAAFVAGRTWRDNFLPVQAWLTDAVGDTRIQKEGSIID